MTVDVVEVQRLCKSGAHGSAGLVATHTKEVQSGGWVRYVCSECGQVKFILGEKVDRENG